jgi:branched-chain amino acid transport system ATP-binding protein
LTVEENLRLGAHAGRRGPWTLDRVFRLFPILAERRGMPATVLSGGEQQMVALGRALMSNPRLLLCDEVSLGLAPGVVRSLYATLAEVRAEGVGMLVVEQDLGQALRSAERAYCLRQGRVVLEGAGRELGLDAIRLAYLGA